MLLRGGDGHRPAPHAGRRRRGGLPGPASRGRTWRRCTPLPWEPGVASCLADLEPASGGHADPPTRAARCAGRRDGSSELGLEPIVGPELEFFLVERDPEAPNGIRRHVDQLSMVYTVGPQADPGGLVRRITEDLAGLGLEVFAVNHEFMNSQYEINLRHADALTAADRAFRLKTAVKDIAAQHGLRRDVHGQAVQRPGRLRHRTCTSRSTATGATRSTSRTTRRRQASCAASSPASSRTRRR